MRDILPEVGGKIYSDDSTGRDIIKSQKIRANVYSLKILHFLGLSKYELSSADKILRSSLLQQILGTHRTIKMSTHKEDYIIRFILLSPIFPF